MESKADQYQEQEPPRFDGETAFGTDISGVARTKG